MGKDITRKMDKLRLGIKGRIHREMKNYEYKLLSKKSRRIF